MSERTLVFVERRADAGRPKHSTDVVVLDTTWSPVPNEQSDLIPVRAGIRTVLERVDLFNQSLERLDAWASAAKLADRFLFEGVSWWFHARSWVRLDMHELLLWRHVLDELAPPGRYTQIVIPVQRKALVAAARAPGRFPGPRVITSGLHTRLIRLVIRSIRARARRMIRVGGIFMRVLGLRRELGRREAILADRMAAFRRQPEGVLTVVRGPSFHAVATDRGLRHTDPYVAPVVRRLSEGGVAVIAVALGMSHREDADWELLKRDEHLVPMSYVAKVWSRQRDEARRRGPDGVLDDPALKAAPLRVGDYDLAGALVSIMPDLGRWFTRQTRETRAAEALMRDLRPAALYTGWEGARTAWLAAARRLGIPSIAVQHGVIYPGNPDYCRPAHHGLLRPDMTCVFGPYERDLLIEHGGYEPDAVVVTGSPRLDSEDAPNPASRHDRVSIRRTLGVRREDRMLVVSGSRFAVGEAFHSIAMVDQVLGGPLPGIHLVFKIHPEEEHGQHYEDLLHGLAQAGGYRAPKISTVRDIDVYRLLSAADAHLGQHSTVLTDAVLTGTPNMIAVGQAWSDVIGYVDAKVAVPVRSVEDVRAFMANPRAPAKEDRARFLDAHLRRDHAAARIVVVIQGAMKPTVKSGPSAPLVAPVS